MLESTCVSSHGCNANFAEAEKIFTVANLLGSDVGGRPIVLRRVVVSWINASATLQVGALAQVALIGPYSSGGAGDEYVTQPYRLLSNTNTTTMSAEFNLPGQQIPIAGDAATNAIKIRLRARTTAIFSLMIKTYYSVPKADNEINVV